MQVRRSLFGWQKDFKLGAEKAVSSIIWDKNNLISERLPEKLQLSHFKREREAKTETFT